MGPKPAKTMPKPVFTATVHRFSGCGTSQTTAIVETANAHDTDAVDGVRGGPVTLLCTCALT